MAILPIHIRNIIIYVYTYGDTYVSTYISHACTYRCVSVMVTTQAMIAAGVSLAIMDLTAANHKFSQDGQLLLTLIKIGKNLLISFNYYVHVILATLLC